MKILDQRRNFGTKGEWPELTQATTKETIIPKPRCIHSKLPDNKTQNTKSAKVFKNKNFDDTCLDSVAIKLLHIGYV